MTRAHWLPWLPLALAACQGPIDAGGSPPVSVVDDDPLAVMADAPPGSLEALHRAVILPSCAGQQGLCHFGQFEPNLSTPALTYENLVTRPGLERARQLRVAPGDPGKSLLIDKLRGLDVISQMPLGAEPMPEADIAAIEAWIQGGALRRPGAPPPPVLNNLPAAPEIGIFDANGARLDVEGPVLAPAGTTLTLRQSVDDFETDDDDMPFVAFVLTLPDGRQVLVDPALAEGGELAMCAYDAAAPPGSAGDLLNWQFAYTVPDTLDVLDPATGARSQIPAAGQSLTPFAAYLDAAPESDGMLVFTIGLVPISVP